MKRILTPILVFLIILLSFKTTTTTAQCTIQAYASPTSINCGDSTLIFAIASTATMVTVFDNDFNNSTLGAGWATNANVRFDNPCGDDNDGTPHAWVGAGTNFPRELTTVAYSIPAGGQICFDMKMSGCTDLVCPADCEMPDEPDEGVYIQFNNGSGWVTIDYYDPSPAPKAQYTNWNRYCYDLPPGAIGPNVQFRWYQDQTSGADVDHWGIDNALIKLNDPNYVFDWSHKPGLDSPTPGKDGPTENTTYTVTYSDGVNSCQSSVSVSVVKPVITALADITNICPGDLVQLDTDNNLKEGAPVCGLNSNRGCSSPPQIVTGDTGQPKSETGDNFAGAWGAQSRTGRMQYIYTANELQTIGLKPGKILSLAIKCNYIEDFSGYVNYCRNFNIKMRCTTKGTYANNDFQGGLTNVYSVNQQTINLGWNTFVLDNAFNWDGTSNIIIDICYMNNQSGDNFSEFEFEANTLGVDRVITTGTNGSSQNYCSQGNASADEHRPITRFEFCEPYNPKFNWVWSPNDGTFNPNVNAKSPTVSPTSTTTYTVSGYVQGTPVGCTVTDQITINVNPAPEMPLPLYNVGLCERDQLKLQFGPTTFPLGSTFRWTGPGAYTSNNKNPTRNGATPAMNGVYTVYVTNPTGCESPGGTVNVTVNPAPTGTITSNTPQCDGFDAVFNLNPNSIDGNPMTFAWTGINGWTSTLEDPTRNDPFPDMNGNHSVVITNSITSCTSLPINHNFVQTDRPVALPFRVTPVKATYCIGEQITFETDVNGGGFLDPNWLDVELGGPNGSIQTVNNQKGTITFNPITLATGDGGDYWLVAQQAANTCITDTAFITIVVVEPGSFTATNNGPICEGEDLQLNVTDGGAGVNYLWSGPNAFGSAVRNATRLGVTAADAGVYTVSVDNGVCTPFDVTTNVVIDSPRDPGTDNTVGICETETNFDLFTALGGTPEALGTWTDDTPSGRLNVDKFDATGLGGNSFNFTHTLTTTNTCPDQSATVTVDVTHQPIAGVDNTVQICNNETALDLFTLLGATAETAGTWNNVAGVGTLSSVNWDATWDATGVAAGDYDFEYTVAAATADCPDATATITVTVIEELDPGTSTTLNMCENDPTAHDLYAALGSPDVGTWTNVNGAFGFNNGAQTFQANAGDGPGTYQFDYTVTAPSCPTKTATVTVISHRAPIAGNNGVATTCNSETAFDLFTGLTGTPDLTNGSWNDIGVGTVTGSSWDVTGVAAGDYTFTYMVTDPTGNCADATAEATITVVDQPISGTASPLDACTNDPAFSLFDGLSGFDTPGQWFNSLGNPITDTFNPGAFTAGTYNFTYTVTGVAPCVDASTVVTVVVEDKPFAGNDGSITVCETQTSADLFAELGGSPDNNGTWNDGGVPGSINTATGELNPSALTPGTYVYTYSVPATTHCAGDDAEVTVTVIRTPVAGDDVTISACNGDNTPINLLNELTANSATTPDVNGSWYNVTGGANVPSGTFNPDGKNPGNYVFEYTVAGTSPCVDDVAQLTIKIEEQPYAGTDNGSATICNLKNNYNLFFALLGGSSVDTDNGFWLDINNTGALSGDQNKIFDASAVGNGTYTFGYKLDAISPCLDDTGFVSITVTGQPDAGQDAVIEICNDRIVDLFSELGGNPHSGGVWTDKADGTGNVVDPATFDANGISGGTYYFRYDLSADAPCQADFSLVTIHVNAQPNAGDNGAIVVCDGDLPFNLFNQLGGSPTSGGSWTDSGNNSVSETFNPATGTTGIYTYTPSIPNQCQVVTANVDLTVNKAPQVTATENCEIDALNYRITLTITGGDPGSYTVSGSYVKGGNPAVPVNGTLVGNTFTSDLIPTKATYTFSVDDANGCGPTVVSKYVDCGCATRVGDMSSAPVEACVGTAINGVYDNTGQVSDGNDKVNFILHDLNDPAFGTILDVNTSIPQFSFISGTMNADQTYYISAVYGNHNAGVVDLNDTCLAISASRTPIRFNSIPNVSMGPDQDLCFGDNRDLVFTFTGGTGDYTVTYDDASTSSGLNNTNNKVNKSPSVTTVYNVTRVTDAKGCFLDVNDSTVFTVIPLPDITMTGDITYCEGTNNPVLTFTDNIPGVGVSPYNITINDPVSGNDVTFNTSDSTVVNFPATGPGTFVYTFKKVTDASSQACIVTPNTTVTVVVDPTPVVSISGDKTICFGDSETIAIDFTTGTAPFTVVYNDGVNPDVVDAGIINDPKVYTFNPSINTTYTFKSVTDDNGCMLNLGNQTIDFTVNQLPVLNDVTVAAPELCNNNSTELLFDVSGQGDFTVDYTINGVANQQVVNGNDSFTINPSAIAGSNTASTYNYVVTRITDNASPYNCVNIVSDSVLVTVYPNPTGTISIAQSPICENTMAQLDFTFTGVDKFDYTFEEVKVGEGSQSFFDKGYNDSFSFVPTLGLTDFTYKLTTITSTATATGFQCTTTINDSVNLLVQLAPEVTIGGDSIMCQNDSREVLFNVTRTTWPVTIELGNDLDASIITYNNIVDGVTKALNPMQPTAYHVVSVKDNSPLGCVGTASGIFNLDVITLPTATMSAPSKICEKDSDFLTFDLKDGRGGYTVVYTDSGQVNTLNYPGVTNVVEQVSINPTIPTKYKLLSVTDMSGLNCSTTYNNELTVDVVPLPVAKLKGNNTICAGDSTALDFITKGIPPLTVTYTDGADNFTLGGIYGSETIYVIPEDSTNYKITSITDGSGAGCTGSFTSDAYVKVKELPNTDFVADTLEQCIPFETTFTNLTDVDKVGEVIWNFGDQTKSTVINGQTIVHQYERAGVYDVSLTVTTPGNTKCTVTETKVAYITANAVPVADFEFFPALPTIMDPHVSFYNQSKDADLYTWLIDDVEVSNGENFSNIFPDDDERSYQVKLIAINNVEPQCVDSITRKILVKGELFVNVPNTFTPNGDDINDSFIPIMAGYDTEGYLFEVYDRWGELVFSTTDHTKAWDGTYKGEKATSDLYIWKLEVKSKYLVEKDKFMGQVRLMR